MHKLQQHILSQLILNSERRYADLKPQDVEGNHFMYHLKCLLKEGLVHKVPNGHYQLSPAGKSYVDRLSLKSLTPRVQPRLVTLMAIQNQEGQWLMYRRRRQPLINMIGLPYGKLHLGETVQEAAERELEEKTGLRAELSHIGDGYANTFEAGIPVSQIMFHMFSGRDPQGTLRAKSEVGETMWMSEADLSSKEIMPNVLDLLDLVRQDSGQRFFAELNHHL